MAERSATCPSQGLYLTTPPVGGKANEAVIACIAKEFGVAKNQVRICR
ncbi:MAG: hypothetical protein B7Z82_07635 [Halothiobacillus sp. 20-54-6]|nr:MAG: hypothetical protein B7Z82_07635 [Halothiobacillus sp. 20-54-6]